GGATVPLHAPKSCADGGCQTPCESRWSELPAAGGGSSETPMSTESLPAAGPSRAVKVPSYERNSTTAPVLSTSAIPAGFPTSSAARRFRCTLRSPALTVAAKRPANLGGANCRLPAADLRKRPCQPKACRRRDHRER